MLFEVAAFAVSVLGLSAATFTDFRERIVPNRLNFFLLGCGLLIHALYSVFASSIVPMLFSLIAAVVAFLFGLLLYKAGVWAGGDVKLLTALGALNPVNPFVAGLFFPFYPPLSTPLQVPVFPITLFVFSVFSMLPVAVLLSLRKIWTRKALRRKAVEGIKKSAGVSTMAFSAFAVGLHSVLAHFSVPAFYLLPFLLAFGLVRGRMPKTAAAAAVFLLPLLLGASSAQQALAEFIALYAVLFVLFNLFSLVSLSREALKRRKKISMLEEGEISAETIRLEGKKAVRAEPLGMKRIINYLKHYRLEELSKELRGGENEIVSSRKARGLTEGEIEKLKEFVKKGMLADSIEVKESAPMVPAMLVAYVVLNFVGDFLWNFLI